MRIGTIVFSILLAGGPALLDAQKQAALAADFTDSVGVMTHFAYTDTPYYQQPDATISAIKRLGVRHIRDGVAYGWVAPNLYSIFARVGQAGLKSDLIISNPVPNSPTPEAIEKLLPNYPGVEAIEAPNEVDLSKNPNWAADLKAFLPTLRKIGRDTRLPVVGPSLTQPASYTQLGDISAEMDYNNYHAYWSGRPPETSGWGGPDKQGNRYGSFAFDFDMMHEIGPGKPILVTESGYTASEEPKQGMIPEGVEAIYEPRLVLHAWNLGVKRTYIYELMDDPSSTPGFGLLRKDMSPRPAYFALATLIHLLSDTPAQHAPGKLDYSIEGDAATLESTLLEKQDGSFWLALWLPVSIYDVDQLHPKPVTAHTITITVPGGKTIKSIWKFDETGHASESTPNRASLTIQADAAVTLLKID